MYTDPLIYNPDDLSKRSFVSFYYNGVRYRFYNGNAINVQYFPNNAKTIQNRQRMLESLAKAFNTALIKGWSPEDKKTEAQKIAEKNTLVQLLDKSCVNITSSGLSQRYKDDVKSVLREFKLFLKQENKLDIKPTQIKPTDIERFLLRYSSSGKYHRTKRSSLSPLFTRLVDQGYIPENPVLKTKTMKIVEVMNEAYTPEQLIAVLKYLKSAQPNLYLCSLMMYGTLLRPHREIRLLKRRHLSADLTTYLLSGYENKGGKVRTLPIPDYVRNELIKRDVLGLNPEEYIFTRSTIPFNSDYFKTLWKRAKVVLLKQGIINERQTLYSIRHTAGIEVFERTGDLRLLQLLLDHGDLATTLIYVRKSGLLKAKVEDLPKLTSGMNNEAIELFDE